MPAETRHTAPRLGARHTHTFIRGHRLMPPRPTAHAHPVHPRGTKTLRHSCMANVQSLAPRSRVRIERDCTST
eukprot:476487-Prymnesium_polylepis.1